MRKVRIAHVITRMCKGGAQENTFNTVRLANRDRFEVDLISGPANGDEGSLESTVAEAGIAIHREPALVREISPRNDIKALNGLTKNLRKGRYDIVHTHTSKAGILGRLAAKRSEVPIIVHTPHGNIFDGYFSPWKTKLYVQAERLAAGWSDRLIELTEGGVREYLDQGIGRPHQYAVIFSGIDLKPYERAIAMRRDTRHKLGVDPADVLIGGIGRLEPVKGFEYFIDAAKRIARAIPQARFVHAGQGSLEKVLRGEAEPLGDRFRFLGFREDIPELMAALDILAAPSLNEGMGRVILEAGAAATPVVASNTGGIPDVVKDGETGVLVPPKSPQAMAEAIIELCNDSARRKAMGAAAQAMVVPEFGIDRMVMRIESMYEELIEEKGLDA